MLAILVIDMQNGFCAEGGSLAPGGSELDRYRRLFPTIGELCAAARAADAAVIYTIHGYRRGYPEAGAELQSLHPEVVSAGGMQWGGWDTSVVAGLEPGEGDHIVTKSRFDAFHGTDLELLLSGLGVDRLLVAGVSTNVCVETTVRSAAQRGYTVGVADDATAASAPALHDAALIAMRYAFAAVGPWRELLSSMS